MDRARLCSVPPPRRPHPPPVLHKSLRQNNAPLDGPQVVPLGRGVALGAHPGPLVGLGGLGGRGRLGGGEVGAEGKALPEIGLNGKRQREEWVCEPSRRRGEGGGVREEERGDLTIHPATPVAASSLEMTPLSHFLAAVLDRST